MSVGYRKAFLINTFLINILVENVHCQCIVTRQCRLGCHRIHAYVFLLKTYIHNSKFAISNALWDSGTIIATTIVGIFWFNEKMNIYEYVGIGLVIIGSIIIGFKTDDKPDLVESSLEKKEELIKNKK